MSPVRPVAAVLAVVVRGRELLLVRRANPPDQGRWGYPGGRIEPGETHLAAAARELVEETGLVAAPLHLLDALDFIEHDRGGHLTHHFAMLAVLCRWQGGDPVAADDALEVGWFTLDGIATSLEMSAGVHALARKALAITPAAESAK